MALAATESDYDVVILGAGAAGLMCALTAGFRGRRVLVVERSNKVGKKILMSGGGRCNFTNLYVEPDNYLSDNPHFSHFALRTYTQWDFINLVDRYQVDYEERRHGQLFCRRSAADILNLLLAECETASVEIRSRVEVNRIDFDDGQFRVGTGNDAPDITSTSLVVATGALSVPTLGGSDLGYKIAEQFGLAVTSRRAGLVPFTFSGRIKDLCERLAGISITARATVSCSAQAFTEQLLFTHRGLSGPVILQISSYWSEGAALNIDLLPGVDVEGLLLAAKANQGASILRSILAEKLPRALVLELQALFWAASADKPLAEWSNAALSEVAGHLANWTLHPAGTEGYRTAEVTLGGVCTEQLNAKTFAAKEHPGLFFVGEVVDVTGHLGGFNFQWAWSSGYCAGLVA